jgi:hypothetical protein
VPADPVARSTATRFAYVDFDQRAVWGAAADRDILRTASSPHRGLDCRTPAEAHQSAMTDHQFQLLLRHLQVIIAILGVLTGVVIALAFAYL